MSLVARYSLYAGIYVACGIALLFTHYLNISPYKKEALDEKLTLIAASHFQVSALVDNLPAIFKENPHAAALKISDLEGAFMGAMYDSRRMSGSEYKTFLDTKAFDPQKSPLPGYTLHIWESKRRHLRFVVLSLNRATFGEYLSIMGRDYAFHYIIPLYLVLGALGLAAFHFFFAQGKGGFIPLLKKTSRSASPPPSHPAVVSATTQRVAPRTNGHAWRLKSGVLADSSIQSTLAHLGRIAGAQIVGLYARTESGRFFSSERHWHGVAEVRGAVTVRGEGMEIPELLAKAQGQADIVESSDKKTWLFLNAPAESATLGFVFTFGFGAEVPGIDLTREIAAAVKSRSRSLLTQHSYENSILDAETGLYSAPYALFSLKEKLRAGQKFAVAAFEFSAADFSGEMSAKTVRTAIRILRENFEAESAPVVARADERTILIIFNNAGTKADKADQSVRELHKAYTNLGRSTAAILIPDATVCGSSQRVLRTLESHLAEAKASGSLTIYRNATPAQLI